MSLLIADLGNAHLGNMRLAKELIRIANESGADLIKSKAYRAQDLKHLSMPSKFYEQCQFTEDQYLELIQYARELKTDMFFSIVSSGFERLKFIQRWRKVEHFTSDDDHPWSVVSFNRDAIKKACVPRIRRAWALYAPEYMPKDPQLENIAFLKHQTKSDVGFSDHSTGVESCLRAIKWHNVNCIEKHFSIQKELSWGGHVYRDTIHGANPRELETIAKALNKESA